MTLHCSYNELIFVKVEKGILHNIFNFDGHFEL